MNSLLVLLICFCVYIHKCIDGFFLKWKWKRMEMKIQLEKNTIEYQSYFHFSNFGNSSNLLLLLLLLLFFFEFYTLQIIKNKKNYFFNFFNFLHFLICWKKYIVPEHIHLVMLPTDGLNYLVQQFFLNAKKPKICNFRNVYTESQKPKPLKIISTYFKQKLNIGRCPFWPLKIYHFQNFAQTY